MTTSRARSRPSVHYPTPSCELLHLVLNILIELLTSLPTLVLHAATARILAALRTSSTFAGTP